MSTSTRCTYLYTSSIHLVLNHKITTVTTYRSVHPLEVPSYTLSLYHKITTVTTYRSVHPLDVPSYTQGRWDIHSSDPGSPTPCFR